MRSAGLRVVGSISPGAVVRSIPTGELVPPERPSGNDRRPIASADRGRETAFLETGLTGSPRRRPNGKKAHISGPIADGGCKGPLAPGVPFNCVASRMAGDGRFGCLMRGPLRNAYFFLDGAEPLRKRQPGCSPPGVRQKACALIGQFTATRRISVFNEI